ncbi:MAG TPA: glycosyl hydrolase family 79 C-terminal domain-containing protein [Candidatus Saccharimonadales bacterium]|nr:glycosyl hydrolase family 79 C-terminal domain-containing protein [Candidatus Saccharimonadales bacterium]
MGRRIAVPRRLRLVWKYGKARILRMYFKRSRVVLVAAGCLAGLALAAVVFVALARQEDGGSAIRQSANVAITIDTSKPVAPVPPRFTGLSFETSSLCSMQKWYVQSTRFTQLLKNIGPTMIRIGGDTADKALWDTDGTAACSPAKTVVTPQLVHDTFTLARAAHANVLWTANLKGFAPAAAADEANYVVAAGGSDLYALGFGNEPDLYVRNHARPATYTIQSYMAEWNTYKKLTLAKQPKARLMGNDGCCSLPWYTNFAAGEASSVSLLTRHYYPTNARTGKGGRIPTTANLLSRTLMQTTAADIHGWVATASERHLPLRIDETNSASGGGARGMSDTFASALWGLDYMFTALENGAAGMDFHEGESPAVYAPINEDLSAMPLYYAMLAFHYAAPNGYAVKDTMASQQPNIASHAVVKNDGTLEVVIINKDLATPAKIALTTNKAHTSATVLRLTAPSVSSTDDVTFGGSAIRGDGTWSSAQKPSAIHGKVTGITVAPVSAVVIELR